MCPISVGGSPLWAWTCRTLKLCLRPQARRLWSVPRWASIFLSILSLSSLYFYLSGFGYIFGALLG
jgi:hypothetical protein